MNWSRLLLTFVVILLYVPMVFLGANVFFPEYNDGFYNNYTERCVQKPNTQVDPEFDACLKRQYEAEQKYYREQKVYEGHKYTAIILFNFVVLLAALFISMEPSVVGGLFLGSSIASFFATVAYLGTRSKIGFGVLVVVFIVTILFINKKKDMFFEGTEHKHKK